LQRHSTLLQFKKVSFEHSFIAVFGSSISCTILISKTNILLCFFHRLIPFGVRKVFSRFDKHNACRREAPGGVWSGTIMVIEVDCCGAWCGGYHFIVAISTGGLWMIRNIFKHCYQKQCFWVNVAVSGLARNFNIDFPIDYSSAAINIIETKSV